MIRSFWRVCREHRKPAQGLSLFGSSTPPAARKAAQLSLCVLRAVSRAVIFRFQAPGIPADLAAPRRTAARRGITDPAGLREAAGLETDHRKLMEKR
jgi:hypothetical protein